MTRDLASAGGRDPALSGFVALLGAWFVATAFLWNRTTVGRAHALVVGLACIAIAVAALRRAAVRWLLVPLALWLFASVWIVPYERPYAVWNNVGIGLGLLLVPFTALAAGRPRSEARGTA